MSSDLLRIPSGCNSFIEFCNKMKQSEEKNAYLLDGFRKHQNRIEMGKSMSPAGEYENKEQAGLADQSNVYAGIKKSLARGYKKVPGLVIRPGTW